MIEGYGNDNAGAKSQGMKQLMASDIKNFILKQNKLNEEQENKKKNKHNVNLSSKTIVEKIS